MIALLCLTDELGRLARYESGGERPRLTHVFVAAPKAQFERLAIERFIFASPEHLRAFHADEAPTVQIVS